MSLTDPNTAIKCFQDTWMQVRTAEGRLLGVVPAAKGVEQIQTKTGKILPVDLLLMTGVRLDEADGVDPFTLHDFVPVPGLEPGPLALEGLNPSGAQVADPDLAKGI